MNKDNKTDVVNSPAHYTQGRRELIDVMPDILSPSEFKGFLKGNCLKYIIRYEYKNKIEDLKKAEWYIKKLTETEEKMMETEEDKLSRVVSLGEVVLSDEEFKELIRLP